MLYKELDMGNRSRCCYCDNLKQYSKLKPGARFTKEIRYSCRKYNTEDFMYAVKHCRLGAAK